MPDTHIYDCFERLRNKSPSQPPRNVPVNPVTRVMTPNVTVAS